MSLNDISVFNPQNEGMNCGGFYFSNSLISHKLEFLVEAGREFKLKSNVIWEKDSNVCEFLIPIEDRLLKRASKLVPNAEAYGYTAMVRNIENAEGKLVPVMVISSIIVPENGYRSAFSLSSFLDSKDGHPLYSLLVELYSKLYDNNIQDLQQAPALEGVNCYLRDSSIANQVQLTSGRALLYKASGFITLSIPRAIIPEENYESVKSSANQFAVSYGVPGIIEITQAGESLIMIQLSEKYSDKLSKFALELGLDIKSED